MFKKTQAFINTYLEEGVFPGVAYKIFQEGEAICEVKGFAQLIPAKEELKLGSLFDMASLTKVICTTTVILKWLEDGKIEIDAPLQKFLPAFQDNQVTIRHLLTHTSDIDGFIPNRDELSPEELQKAFYQLKSGANRGRKKVYTDTGTILLGFMMEEMTGMPVQKLFEIEVLVPLGMKEATFSPSNPALCAATEKHLKRGVIRGVVHDPKAFTLGSHCGSAGLFCNLSDTEKFVEMLLRKGRLADGTAFLQTATIESLLQDWTLEAKVSRSLGWDLKYDLKTHQPILFHTGYTGTFLLVDVLQQSYFIFLSNRVHPSDYREEYIQKRDQLIQVYLEEKAERER